MNLEIEDREIGETTVDLRPLVAVVDGLEHAAAE